MATVDEVFADVFAVPLARVITFTPCKTCSCGRTFTRTEWRELPLLGLSDTGDGLWLELRNCPSCHSTMGRELHIEADWLELSGILNESCQQLADQGEAEMKRGQRLADEARKAILAARAAIEL